MNSKEETQTARIPLLIVRKPVSYKPLRCPIRTQVAFFYLQKNLTWPWEREEKRASPSRGIGLGRTIQVGDKNVILWVIMYHHMYGFDACQHNFCIFQETSASLSLSSTKNLIGSVSRILGVWAIPLHGGF